MSVDWMMVSTPKIYCAERGIDLLGWYPVMNAAVERDLSDGTDGTKPITLLDQSGRGLDLSLVAGTPVYLSSSAALGNVPGIRFDGDAYFRGASGTEADWTRLHDGTGATIFACFRPTVAVTGLVITTAVSVLPNVGAAIGWDAVGGLVGEILSTTDVVSVAAGLDLSDRVIIGAAAYKNDAGADDLRVFEAGHEVAHEATLTAPSPDDPFVPLTIGGAGDGGAGYFFDGYFCDAVLIGRKATVEDASFMWRYMAARAAGYIPTL